MSARPESAVREAPTASLYAWCDHRLFDAGDGALLFGTEDASLFAIDAATRDAIARWRHR